MLQATEQGLGLAVVRELLAADALRDGRLARLFDVSLILDRVQPYSLVYPPALKNWPPLIALRDWVRHEFECSLSASRAGRGARLARPAYRALTLTRRAPRRPCRPWARRTSPAPGRLPAARRPCRGRGPSSAARPTRRTPRARPRSPATGACCSGPRWPGWPAALLRDAGAHAVDGDAGVVVDPDHRLAVQVAAGLRLESAGRRLALVRQQLRRILLAGAGHRDVAARLAQDGGRLAHELAAGAEHVDARRLLVDDHERAAVVVPLLVDPVLDVAGVVRGVHRFASADRDSPSRVVGSVSANAVEEIHATDAATASLPQKFIVTFPIPLVGPQKVLQTGTISRPCPTC